MRGFPILRLAGAVGAAALAAWASAAPATLKFWAVTGSVKDVAMYKLLAEDFRRQSGIEVEVTPLAWGNFQTKYFAAMAANLPPDIGVTNLGGPFDYGAVGGLVDLRAEFPDEIAELEARFDPKVLPMFTLGDRLFGLPSDLTTLVLFYRTDVFARLGLRPPKTWSEMNALLGRLEAEGYRYYFGWTQGAQWALGLYTMPYGLPSMRLDETGEPGVNWLEPDYQRGVFQALQLWHAHESPGKDLGSRLLGMFRSNDKSVATPFIVDLPPLATQIPLMAPEIADKWGVAPWPRADDGSAFNVIGGTTYVIFRSSPRKREAFAWLKYLNSVEAQKTMILHRMNRGDESGLTVSPIKAVWEPDNDAFWARREFARCRPLVEVIRGVIPTLGTAPQLHGSTEAGRIEANLLDQMGTSIRDRLDALAGRHNTTRERIVADFGAGRRAEEKAAFDASIRAELKKKYAEAAPQATAILRKETARYEQRFGNVIRALPSLERRTDALDVVRWVCLGLFGLGLAAVAGIPRVRRHWVSYLFIATPMLLALVFVFVPAIVALFLSFTEYHPVLPLSTAKWVGVQNYAETMASGDLPGALLRTLKYALLTMPTGIFLSLVFAYLLNQNLRGERFWRFLYFSPLVTSVVSIALIFSQLFLSGKQGWLNALLLGLGMVRDPVAFLTSERTFLDCVIVLAVWHGLAFTILVFLAGLQQIPQQHFEAAAVDGAGPIRRFWSIAVPGLRPQLFFITVLGLIGSFQVFETIYTLANKSGDAGARFGPNDSALTLVPLIYHTGFETFEMGRSAATAYILFFLILVLTVIQFQTYRRREA